MATSSDAVTCVRGVTVVSSNFTIVPAVVDETLPVTASSVAARAWRTSASALRICAAATAADGLRAMARWTASAKVTRGIAGLS
jgi:hypothetical protein